MAERSTLNQVIQLGVETTPGTAVAATKRLASVSIEPSPTVETDQFRPAGQKYRSFATLGKESVSAAVSGKLTYNELVYLLSSVVTTATPSTPQDATNTRLWNFFSNPSGDDTPKTYTVEHGSSVRADRFAHGLMTEFGLSISRSSCDISGTMIGMALEDPVTMTSAGSVTQLDLLPVLPTHCSIYMADDIESLGGGSKLTRVLGVNWSLGSRFNPIWPIDAALDTSFAAVIESEPDLSMSLTMEADAAGMGPLEDLRDGATKFIRIEAVGSEIETNFNRKITIDTCVQVVDTGGFQDNEGVYAVEWQFIGINDPDWTGGARAFNIAVQNELASL